MQRPFWNSARWVRAHVAQGLLFTRPRPAVPPGGFLFYCLFWFFFFFGWGLGGLFCTLCPVNRHSRKSVTNFQMKSTGHFNTKFPIISLFCWFIYWTKYTLRRPVAPREHFGVNLFQHSCVCVCACVRVCVCVCVCVCVQEGERERDILYVYSVSECVCVNVVLVCVGVGVRERFMCIWLVVDSNTLCYYNLQLSSHCYRCLMADSITAF